MSLQCASPRRSRFLGLTLVALVASACGDSSTAPGGEQELISRVTLTLAPQGGGTSIVSYIDDADGAGPGAPAAQNSAIALTQGVTYVGSVKFENRLANPVENITDEVVAEANEHRVYYTVTGTGATVTITDADGAARPLGVTYTFAAGASVGAGTLRTVLCHYGDSPKPSTGTVCTGDTDIDVTFNFTVVGAP